MPSPTPPTTIAKPASPAAPASPSAPSQTSNSPPPTTAIYKVNTTLSSVYTHVHTPLLFSSVFFSLPALVANPLSTLTYGAGALALVQSAYCAICLQPALGGTATKKKKKKTKAKVGPPGAQVKKEEEVDLVGPAIDIAYVRHLSPPTKAHKLTHSLTAPRNRTRPHDPLHRPRLHCHHPSRRTINHAPPAHHAPDPPHRLPRPLPTLLRPPPVLQTLA